MSARKYMFLVFLMCSCGALCVCNILAVFAIGVALAMSASSIVSPLQILPYSALMVLFGGASMLFASSAEGLLNHLSRKDQTCSENTKSS